MFFTLSQFLTTLCNFQKIGNKKKILQFMHKIKKRYYTLFAI